MEIIRGKDASFLDAAALAERLAGYATVHVDIGTGDGRFAQDIARTQPDAFAIGIDACRENLRDVSRRAPQNTLFVIAQAQALPCLPDGRAARITINFPWGSLLDCLLAGDEGLIDGLRRTAGPHAVLDVRLNAGALAEAGWPLDDGARRVRDTLASGGFDMRLPAHMTAKDLKSYPTTWAKRIGFGRDPRAVWLRGAYRVLLSSSDIRAYATWPTE